MRSSRWIITLTSMKPCSPCYAITFTTSLY
ncbi:Uncharacterised protein [Vibrio cholerae]|nr:Uncharacterised protein [Vibrio cholerae]